MEKFSYTLELYKSKIFNIDTDKDCKELKKATEDAEKIELYFNDVINKDLLRKNIILSFWFKKNMDYKDRINYIRGIVYSRRYIDYNDVYSLLDELEKEIPVPETTVFEEKGDYTYLNQDFFLDAFYEDIRTNYESYIAYQQSLKDVQNSSNVRMTLIYDKEDEENDDFDDEELTDEEARIKMVEELEEELKEGIINLTQKEKIELFEDNFENYINIMLKRKNVTTDINNRGRQYIVIGMRDWFYYIIGMMKDIVEIDENQKKILSNDLSKFI